LAYDCTLSLPHVRPPTCLDSDAIRLYCILSVCWLTNEFLSQTLDQCLERARARERKGAGGKEREKKRERAHESASECKREQERTKGKKNPPTYLDVAYINTTKFTLQTYMRYIWHD